MTERMSEIPDWAKSIWDSGMHKNRGKKDGPVATVQLNSQEGSKSEKHV